MTHDQPMQLAGSDDISMPSTHPGETDHDPTSGAFNHTYLEDRLELEQDLATKNAKPFALLLIDIDDFTLLNDKHGRSVGDAVLRVLAASVNRLLKPDETLGRWGGDEFMVLCRETTLRNGLILAERIRSSIQRLPFSSGTSQFHVSVSIGVASTNQGNRSGEPIIACADRALQQAKQRGRNSIFGGG